MFSSFLDSNNRLLVNRLSRAQAQILALKLSTKEEFLAQTTSIVNMVINTDYMMQSLIPITPAAPALVGDPVSNLLTLNDDASDIADEISRLEDDASTLFNLCAASRNATCQAIREAIYASSSREFIEQFINQSAVDSSSSAEFDMNAGVVQLPLSSEMVLTPTFAVGQNAIGSTTGSITSLQVTAPEALFTWNGPLLEIIVSFPAPTIVNRMNISPDTYVGYEVTTFTASADGSQFENILSDINTDALVLDASAGKFSGSTVVDFPPRSVSKIRLVIQNLTTSSAIGLRTLQFTQRNYQATGAVVSKPQTTPSGTVQFSAQDLSFDPFVSLTYQISGDSVHYTTIVPGQVTLPAQWWYRVLFNRSTQAFAGTNAAVDATTADPTFTSGFTLVSSKSIPLDPTTIERTLVLANITTPIPLAETPIPGTLQVSEGSLYLDSSGYSLSISNALTIVSPTGPVTVTYQTSAQGIQDLSTLENFYTPALLSVTFGN
jgi:hypothetical protein